IGHDRQPAEIRNNLAQKFESLTSKISVLDRESGDVPARVSQTRDETGANRVRCRREDYRDDRCCPLCRENYWGCICDNDIDFKSDELGSELGGPIAASLRPAILDDEVATLGPAEFAQPLQKSSDPTALGGGHRYRAQDPEGGQLARLLRARRERPRNRRAADERDELAAFHSMTSSASDVPWLPVTLLIRADKLCIGQDVAPHCSLDLRFRRVS